MDEDRLDEAIRRLVEQDKAASPELRESITQITKFLSGHVRRFSHTKATVQEELRRGARLTKHKINL